MTVLVSSSTLLNAFSNLLRDCMFEANTMAPVCGLPFAAKLFNGMEEVLQPRVNSVEARNSSSACL
jgi:hypothetical protein